MCDNNRIVDSLIVYNDSSRGVYRGISKLYFPKWVGWSMIESGASSTEVDQEVYNFYLSYFYYQMKLDDIQNQAIACAIMNFATLNGKKKAIQKLQKVTNSQAIGFELIALFNSLGKCGEYQLLLEFMEFYSFTGEMSKVEWLTRAYRCL